MREYQHHILSIVVILLSLVSIININDTFALNYSSDVDVSFTFNPTLSINLSPSNLIISNLTPGTTSNSNEITISVATNNAYGYSLYASVGNSTYNNTNLNHSDNAGIFSSIAANAYIDSLGTDNTWGYTYSLDSGTSWIPYNGLPLYTSSQNKITMNTEPSQEIVDFKIAARAGEAQPSGIYNNVINFAAIATISPTTLAEAYESEGKAIYNGYYKMQDMTDAICDKTEDINAQLQVIDVRDNKVYWIAKLADGHCWMTQNLAYSITKDANDNIIPLTSEDTDLNEYGANNYTSQYGYNKDANDIISWTPENVTVEFSGTDATTAGWATDIRKPYSAKKTDDTSTGHESRGNYYNWPAATTTNQNWFTATATIDNINNNPKNSICPKGWRLPTVSTQSEMVDGSTSEFARLNYLYNNNASNTNANWLAAPLYFVKRGFSTNTMATTQGFYWSSTIGFFNEGTKRPISFILDNNSINTSTRTFSSGFSVRCVAR